MDNQKTAQVREFLIIFLLTFIFLQVVQYFFSYNIQQEIDNIAISSETQVLPPNADLVKQDFNLYTISFNTLTGDIESLSLNLFHVAADDSAPIETLFNRQAAKQIFQEQFFYVDFKDKTRKQSLLKDFKILPGATESFFKTKRVFDNFEVIDSYNIDPDNPYSYTRTSIISKIGPQTQQLYRVIGLVNTNKALIKGTEEGSRMFQGASFHTDKEKFKKIPFTSFSKTPFAEISQQGWLSFSQRYFATGIFVPKEENSGKFYTLYSSENATSTAGHVSDKIVLTNESPEYSYQLKFYSGPEERSYLQKFAPNFEYVIDYGMLWFLSSIIMQSLTLLNNFINNWGFSIIIMTIALRGALQLISFGQQANTAKMQAVKKKQQELTERYGDNHEALNKALLEFYKQEKINPIISLSKTILPLIFQIMMFLAFYSTLMEAVDLRQASFFYIQDLSLRDPYYALPISLVVISYIQQYFSPKPDDENFAMIMRFSPLMFGFIAVSFPAGLVLYWLTSTLYSFVQTIVTKMTSRHAIA